MEVNPVKTRKGKRKYFAALLLLVSKLSWKGLGSLDTKDKNASRIEEEAAYKEADSRLKDPCLHLYVSRGSSGPSVQGRHTICAYSYIDDI